MKRLICILALMVWLVPAAALAGSYTVSVSQFVEHPALDAVLKGFQDYFKQAGVDIDYNVHNAQANVATTVQIASQIMGENADLVLAIATPSAQSCAQKIRETPVLFTAITDPVAAGLVASMENPGANVTGMTDKSPVGRQLELIREFHPDMKRVGTIYKAGEANSVVLVGMLRDAAAKHGIEVVEATVSTTADVYTAAKSLAGRCDAVYIPTDNTVVTAFESVVKVCNAAKLPLYAADNDSVNRGAIAALAVDYYRMGVQSGAMAERILKDGASPAAMPVESLQDLYLYVNPSAAEAQGVTVPDSVMQRADKIIK